MSELKKTAFYDNHVEAGAKIVPFAGFSMPVQYPKGIVSEHNAVRTGVGVFDVSHMGEIEVSGDKALDFVQKIVTNDVSKLFPGRVQYAAMCYSDGGIVDDLLIYCQKDKYLLVVNASNLDKDYGWITSNNDMDVTITNTSDNISQLAVQGPKSRDVMKKLTDMDLDNLKYYYFLEGKVAGYDMLFARTGYTGELGYELYFPKEYSADVWKKIFDAGEEFGIEPIGLGARDSLRLEKGFSLYGNDIDQTTNPLEAGLGWITKLKKQDFIGKNALLAIKEKGLKRKIVPFILNERGIPRHGYKVIIEGKEAGEVTSGMFSQKLEKGIGMAYVPAEYAKKGGEINIQVRKQLIPATISTLPFV